MSIFVNLSTKLLVQGITGLAGAFHTSQMLKYGTKIVAGVTPGKDGKFFEQKVPIFNSVKDAVNQTKANASIIYVPAPFAADAIIEGVESELDLAFLLVDLVSSLSVALPEDVLSSVVSEAGLDVLPFFP